MSSLKSKDRVSLCSFTFEDGRRCRAPRLRDNSRFCPYHAQKEARARAAQSLGKDLAYFFSGDYLSACDLSTALGRLIPAVIRGDVKPRTARTVAYLAQTLMQAIHISQHEYCEAFDTDDWRQSIRNSVKGNHDYLFPPAPKPAPSHPAEPQPQPQPQANNPGPTPQPTPPNTPQPQPAQTPVNCHSSLGTHHSPLPHTPLPPTSAEFAQHVMADHPRSLRLGSTGETGGSQAPQPAPTPANCHPDPVAQASRPEGSASSSSPLVTSPAPVPQVQQPASAPLSTPPQPAPVPQPFASLALPLPVRRRLHRAPA
jgi:hypothetical protein